VLALSGAAFSDCRIRVCDRDDAGMSALM
jgi:hypothetical protein